jgi:NAD(P)-dependent dehydrogenase (short-subunit alcohol dehydrogenase family)
MHIVISGCSRGLGNALVHEFIALGHTVSGCARDGGALHDLRKQYCRYINDRKHSFTRADVTNFEEVMSWAWLTLGNAGPPDLLINNAAVMNNPAPLWEILADEFDQLMRVNVSGVANCIRAFVPWMAQRRSGIIVNLSSGWGRSTAPDVAPYCASKYAIEGLTLALAQELPNGMAAIPLNPGVINTDMLQQCWADGADRYPTATEWARIAAPYILNLSTKHNGQSLTVRGVPE